MRLRKGADLEWVTPHALRRTATTRIAAGLGVGAASAFLNHSSVAITEKHYIEAAEQLSPDVRAVLDGLAPPPHRKLVERPI